MTARVKTTEGEIPFAGERLTMVCAIAHKYAAGTLPRQEVGWRCLCQRVGKMVSALRHCATGSVCRELLVVAPVAEPRSKK
jgi:hypothetical protein